jgi:hypothetical protein
MAYERIVLPFAATPVLELHAAAASVSLQPVEAGEVPRLEARSGNRRTQVSVRQEGERVIAEVGTGFWHNHVRLDLFLPANVRARVHAENGRLRAEGLLGADLDLETGAGVIQLNHVYGDLRLRAGAGSISARDCGGRFDVEAGAGSVGLDIARLEPGRHRVHSNMGAVRIGIARGVVVKIEAETHMGSVRNRYPSTADAPAVLALSTNMGAVKVRETGETDPSDWLDVDAWMEWAERHWLQGPPWRREAQAAPPPPAPSEPQDNIRRVLEMVQAGKITPQDAEALLRAMNL